MIKLIKILMRLTKESKFEVEDIRYGWFKRSKHSNAYFTGLFGKKEVFFDTCLSL